MAPAKKTNESAKLAISEEEKLNMMIPFGLEKAQDRAKKAFRLG
jgi:hypothetical protein